MTKDEIRKLRCSERLSQKQFAAVLGVTPLSVTRWEQGRVKPSPIMSEMLTKFKEDREKQKK